tara:strand:- start:932 stop:1495 length:564 start_codon:yes stop_codon:yes gene_type:complete
MIYIGYGLFALAIGFFIGASNTPVVVAFLAAIGGLISVFFGAFKLRNDNEKSASTYLGKLLSIFSVCLVTGEIGGEAHRNEWIFNEYSALPWGEMVEPEDTYEALDWIIVKSKLSSLGYSDGDISKIYAIRLSQIKRLNAKRKAEIASGKPDYELTKIYDRDSPFNQMLSLQGNLIKQKGRGPASVD